MINVIDSNYFSPKEGENYFFDNNIWMYLFCPIGNYNQFIQNKSSRVLSEIKSNGAKIIVNNLVLSEFANAYIRLEYNIWKSNQTTNSTNYKRHFKITQEFRDTQIEIKESLHRIIKLSSFGVDNLALYDFEEILLNTQTIDFNDAYYLEFCKTHNYKFVSNDSDFLNNHVEIDLVKL